ncbi:MAG: MATE family efflux transporter [Nevskiaceae bacterium]|nr:MAG: MATE family efflux transporter [Nevskiaceae bacterium]TBR74186.1 MAG: MATE family efflux transporter [Nevskiaceae bacterium]
MGAVDIAMAGHFNAHALGAVAVGANVWMLGVVATVGVMMALSPSVAQLDGAGRQAEVGALFRQALWLAAGMALLVAWGARHSASLLALLGVEPALVVDAQAFLHALSWGAPGLCGYFALRGLCEGSSWARPTMVFGLFGLAVLVPLDWIFIYGKFGMPAFGAEGAGIANAIALWLQFAAFGIYLLRSRRFAPLRLFTRWDGPDWRALRELLWIGVPMAVTFLMEAGLFIVSGLLISRMGVVAIDGHQVAINVSSLVFMVPLGLALAVTVRTGFAAGRSDVHGVRWAAGTGVALTLVTQTVSASLLLSLAGPIARLYTDVAPVVALAAQLLLFAGAFQIVDGIQAVSNGALRGLKDTRVPMLITAFAYWGVGMPVGAWLAFVRCQGPAGMWVGMIAGLSVAALLLFSRLWVQLRSGGWRRFAAAGGLDRIARR